MLYYTTSPQRMIPPPIKRSRILVSGGVIIVISVKLYIINSMAATLVATRTEYSTGKFPCPDILRPEQKVALCAANKTSPSSTSGFSESSFLTLFTLYPRRVERRTSLVFSPSLQRDSYCTVANEFQDGLIDDRCSSKSNFLVHCTRRLYTTGIRGTSQASEGVENSSRLTIDYIS
jgi:hypothetical protein